MGFDFEVRFSGVQVFAFPDSKPSKGHALLIRSNGHAAHRPQLNYWPRHVSPASRPVPDPVYAGPLGKMIAHRDLVDEVLTIEPTWTCPHLVQPLRVDQAPARATALDADAFEATWLDHTAVLSEIDDRVVPPVNGDRDHGVRPDCLGDELAPTAPAVARVDFAHGRLACGPIREDVKWRFAGTGVPVQWLARWVTLKISGVDSVRIRSNRGLDLVFDRPGDPGIVVSVANEPVNDPHTPEAHADHGHAGAHADDVIPHFPMLYEVVDWIDGRPPADLRVPVIELEDGRSIEDKICPTASYALPKP